MNLMLNFTLVALVTDSLELNFSDSSSLDNQSVLGILLVLEG